MGGSVGGSCEAVGERGRGLRFGETSGGGGGWSRCAAGSQEGACSGRGEVGFDGARRWNRRCDSMMGVSRRVAPLRLSWSQPCREVEWWWNAPRTRGSPKGHRAAAAHAARHSARRAHHRNGRRTVQQQQRTRFPPWARVNQACRGGTLCARAIDDGPSGQGNSRGDRETSKGRRLDKEGLAHGSMEAVHPKNQEWLSRSEPSKTKGGPP